VFQHTKRKVNTDLALICTFPSAPKLKGLAVFYMLVKKTIKLHSSEKLKADFSLISYYCQLPLDVHWTSKLID